ncbi:hypothetical protein MAR_029466 [Mya arenaria]|uniref:Uncharacterized protein n=1 Tax=Mya arenaria TaxID=6604 RepID=A0ABY7DII1_MYAAR|nr:hypothetical protein MAR_029466 [Mya arenaria]
MELMQADELDLYSGMFPAETEQEEIVCGCRGRGRRVKKAPRLPLIAMVMRMELNEASNQLPPKTAFNPHRRNMAGVVDSRDSSLSSRNDETGEVKSKIRKRYFDFAQANQDLLQEFPLTMPTKRILTLTRHNLDKFNAQSSDSESCKSGSVNDKDDVNSNQTDISNVSNLNGSNFSEEDNNPDPTDHAQSGQDVKFEGSDKQDSDKLFPINTDVNAVIDFDRKVAQAYMTPDQVLANSTKSETESASVARTASEKIGSLEEFSSSAAESDIPCLNKKLESGENSYYALTKPEKIVPKINSTSLSQPVYVEGKETDSELEGFQTVKHKVRRKTPPKAIVAVRPLQQTDTVWRLYGRDVIQVDGLPAVSDVSHLHSLVSGFGIIIDHQVCLENGATAIRFKLCSAESCEFCVQCLDGSDCILPDSNSRISCRHLTV